jgi:hypothetical protein
MFLRIQISFYSFQIMARVSLSSILVDSNVIFQIQK